MENLLSAVQILHRSLSSTPSPDFAFDNQIITGKYEFNDISAALAAKLQATTHSSWAGQYCVGLES
jgi:hypothetical protein